MSPSPLRHVGVSFRFVVSSNRMRLALARALFVKVCGKPTSEWR